MITWPRFLILGVLLFASLLPLRGQQQELYFKRIDQAAGLSHNKVNCILQDRRGFVWIGTDDGLNRYDGHNFVVFKNIPGQPSSLSGNTIRDIQEDKDGILWIATADGGFSRYDYRQAPDWQFRQYKHHPGDSTSIPVNIVNALVEDGNEDIWLATSGAAVLRFDKKKESFFRTPGAGHWTINDIAFDSKGTIWAGREGGGILKLDPVTMRWWTEPGYEKYYAGLPHMVVTRLFRDSRHHMWFGSWDKALYRYNAATQKEDCFLYEPGQPYSFGRDEPISFNEDGQGRIWIGTKTTGLYVYDPRTGRFYNYRHDPAREGSLSHNRVNCIFISPTGTVWLGTDQGISLHNPAQLPFSQQFLPGNPAGRPLQIYDFLKMGSGDLWIGTSEGLYRRKADGSYNIRNLAYNNTPLAISRIFRDDDGTIYLGTNYSLFHYDPVSAKVSLMPNTEKDKVMARLIESRIISIVKDTLEGRPVLWTTPYGHFFTYYDLGTQQWVSRFDSTRRILDRYDITDNLIRKIVKTRDGTIWFANAKNGLLRLNKNGEGSTVYINNPSARGTISNNNVYDIAEDARGNLWVSTYGGGLNYLNRETNTFEHYSSVNNLLEGLSIDEKGMVWAICNGGLQRFDPRTRTFTYYELPDVEKTGGVRGYIFKDGEGRMYVAGPGYYIGFQPEEIAADNSQPEVYLTDISIFDKSYAHLLSEPRITLRHDQNFFTLHFAAPYFGSSSVIQYSYMLEGVDKDWKLASASSPQAQYTNLGGGDYTFKVMAAASTGAWGGKVTTIRIQIIPPFWKRGWFFAALALALAALIYSAYRYRINELLKRQAIRNKIAQDLHDNMGSTLSSISVYSQVAKIYNEKERHQELQGTLEKIGTISGEMISEMNDIVWAINPRNDNMETILQRMDSFAKPLLASQGIQFHFQYEKGLKYINLDMSRRKNFYLIFKESVNNALKYSEAKNLWVDIRSQRQQLVLTIRDDGKGFDAEAVKAKISASLTGNGLENMKMRAEEVGGEFRLESSPGSGTAIWLSIPIP